MIWLSLAALLLAILAAVGWYGSHTIFHPSKMLPHVVWPRQFGLAFDPVEFRSEDGLKLKGWLIPAAKPTDRTILLCHGWGDNKGDLLQYTHFLQERFNLFYFDFRSHGESEGTIATLGCRERFDVAAALDCLKKVRPAWAGRLGVYGFSMGAAPTAWVAARNPEIRGVVLETPMSSFRQAIAQWGRINIGVPYFPLMAAVYWACRLRLGEDPESYGPIYQVHKLSPRPLLIIAAEHDTLMLPSVVRALYDKAGEPKDFWLVKGACHRHPQPVEVAEAEYKKRLIEFFEKCL